MTDTLLAAAKAVLTDYDDCSGAEPSFDEGLRGFGEAI